jgi:RNA polymerase-binding transcription factor DksA
MMITQGFVEVRKSQVPANSLQEVREHLLEYVKKSSVLSDEELQGLRDGGPYRHADVFDVATHLECHATKVAINDVIRCNVIKAVSIISSIDDGWNGACVVCGEMIPLKRILLAYSQECIDCKKKHERKAKGER